MKRPSYLLRGVEAFKGNQRAKSSELAPGQVFAVRKEAAGGVEQGEGETLNFILSTSAVDRSGDVVSQDGWHLENYRKNPVVLWAHDQSSLPVAKAPGIVIEDGKLKARGVEFAPYDFAQLTRELYLKGFLSAVSVGFMPRKWVWNEERGGMAMDFQEQELLEFSCVPVPANQEALREAKAAGLNLAPLTEWAEKVLDGEGKSLVVPREAIEALHKSLAPSKSYSLPHEAKADEGTDEEEDEDAEDALLEGLENLAACVERLCAAVEANTAEVKAMRAQPKAAPAPAPTFTLAPKPSAKDIARMAAEEVTKQLSAITGRNTED